MFVTTGSRANRKRIGAGGGTTLPLVGNGQTYTVSTPLLDLSQTWNNAAVAFTALKLNATNTASAAGSLLADLQVGAVSQFSVDKAGNIGLASNAALKWNAGALTLTHNSVNSRLEVSGGGVLVFNSTGGVFGYNVRVIGDTIARVAMSLDGADNGRIHFSTGSAAGDLGLSRNAAGVLEINSTTQGTLRDLKLRTLTGSGATVTASTPLIDMSQTWNNAAVAFTALKLNVTNTLSANYSLLLDLQVGSVSKFGFVVTGTNGTTPSNSLILGAANSPAGFIYNVGSGAGLGRGDVGGNFGVGYSGGYKVAASGDSAIGWATGYNGGGGGDYVAQISTTLYNDAAYVIAQRNGANANTFRVYNTADAGAAAPTNYERGIFDWTTTANVLTIGTEAGGTGTARAINIVSASATGVQFTVAGGTYITIANGFIDLIGSAGIKWESAGSTAGFNFVAANVLAVTSGAFGATVSGWLQWVGQTRVTTNFTSSNAALTAITGISSVALQAGRNYSFRAWLAVTGSSLAGVQVGITCSSTTITTLLSDGFMHDAGVSRGSSVGVINSTGTPVVAVSSATVTSSNPSIRVDGMIRVASSGLFGLTVAQSTASATQVIVSSASYMIVYDMP